MSSSFGPSQSGLQLAVTIHSGSATFRLRNTSAAPITFVERYSCSGLSHFSISVGATKRQLNRHYHYEPRVKGMTTNVRTVCTRNGAVKMRTVGPGKTTSIRIPFARGVTILQRGNNVLRANALLMLRGHHTFTQLHSALIVR